MDKADYLINKLYAEATQYRIPMYKVAEEAGVAYATISQWRTAGRDPSLRNYLRVRDAVERLTAKYKVQREEIDL